MKTRAHFIQHCDFCDLGTFEYTCPSCGTFNIDYDIWWKEDGIYDNPFSFKCEKCETELLVTWAKDEYVYWVSLVNSA